ncbi:MAG: hypothetical protein CMP33_07105 [Rickettsiales bacterium]|nr:hypothetical protein [Rickettsiales bacterium]|tara:strand:- start:408 stop:1076 length:669 start_codon:yes stop_codon:yes gene_type:complete
MNRVNFLNIELEYNEKVFRPTLLSEKCALNTNFKEKNILDLGCGIGPLAIYFAKNGAASVDAIDIYDAHLQFAKKNSVLNKTKVNIFKSNLFQNVSKKYDLICCDVSGVKEEVARLTGWFPEEVPKADFSGANLILDVITNSKEFLVENGELIICTTSFSDEKSIFAAFEKFYPNSYQEIYSEEVPFSKRLNLNVDILDIESFYNKDGINYWRFSIFSLFKT